MLLIKERVKSIINNKKKYFIIKIKSFKIIKEFLFIFKFFIYFFLNYIFYIKINNLLKYNFKINY
jgi:hypothetical protein